MVTKLLLASILTLATLLGFKLYTPLFTEPISENDFLNYNVTIYRDTWGVPHIFGNKDGDTAYGLAYAHAEDDFKTIQDIMLALKGRLALEYGKDAAPNDYMVQLLKIWQVVEDRYSKDISKEVQDICEAYADGLNHYALLHPNEVIRGMFPIDGKDVVAGFVHRTPLMFGLDKVLGQLVINEDPNIALNNKLKIENPFDNTLLGSNVIAVSPSRSADQFTRLAINSHQPWTGPVAWYEAHLHSEEGWNVNGGLFPGSPVVLVGHNKNLGWSHTVNSPDLIDVYELEINPENKNKYFFEGEWKDLQVSKISIPVKLIGPFSWTFHREALRSIHGPVIRNEQGAFAIRFSGSGEVRHVEQWFRMNKSKNLKDFTNAMKMMALPMFNTVYADKVGNIFYVYNALLPKRNINYDWSGILPGDQESLIWKDYYKFEELPQVLNPISGFLQNCNSSPFLATDGDDNPKEASFPKHMGIETFQTNRALRVIELFSEDKSITKEEFYNNKFDTYYSKNSVLAINLNRFLNEAVSQDKDINEALKLMRNWDLNTDSTTIAMHLAYETIRPVYDPAKYIYDYDKNMNRLKDIITWTKAAFGKIEVKWGDIQRLKRGNTNLALSGGPDVLRAVYSKQEVRDKVGIAGDCYFEIVEWDKNGNVFAQSIHQFGTATQDSTSFHYDDQAKLFAKHKMKPVWMNLEDIKLNLEKAYHPGLE
ncbi:MAG: acylase [Fidelibacterota bacterium]|jgi:acyl-homoserine-lactone acylase|nr:acylase [Candidatus Neomarinimicrobiota bacterium]|tara:strand:+ start:16491 stop:18611 length:2121 start_codon:yes stop_codon:yes gene_type:complete